MVTQNQSTTIADSHSGMMIFQHEMFGEVRIIDQEGEPWFVARDVAAALGYKDTSQAVRNHCKGVVETPTPSAGGTQLAKIIPESDVYRLVMRSKLPDAEVFQDWVCGIVLPQIRKTGGYQLQEESFEELTVRALSMAQARIDTMRAKIAEDAPKVEFHDRVTGSETVCQLGVAAQVADLPFGRNTLFRRLREQGVLIASGERRNHPRQEYVNRGYFTVVESAYTDPDTEKTYVTFVTQCTQRGIDWLIRRFGE